MMYVLWPIVGSLLLAVIFIVYGLCRSSGAYDRDSDQMEAEITTALEGALIAELSDISFASTERRTAAR